jgi:hypothetical protein
MHPVKQTRGHRLLAAELVPIALAMVLLSAQTVPVPALSSDLLLGVTTPLRPPAAAMAHSMYVVALVRDPGISQSLAYKATRDLEEKIIHKLGDPHRVQEVDNEFSKIKGCAAYPCEAVVEEVFVTGDNRYTLQLELKLIPPPRDRSLELANHPGIKPSYSCTLTKDFTADDCRESALDVLAGYLHAHDETYHQRHQ